MHIYHFRVLSDENDNFQRDIEIQSTQTFEDFREVLHDCIKFKGNELSSFFKCEADWSKSEEITLIEMPVNDENPQWVMSDCIIRDFVDDPHQRFIYEYDFLNLNIFFIELLKIKPLENGIKYPRCIFSSGENQAALTIKPYIELQDELMDEFNDLLHNDFSEEDEASFHIEHGPVE